MITRLYHIDYDRLVQSLVPRVLRRSLLLAYLRVYTGTVVMLYQDLLRYRSRKLYELSLTPQVCYLERLLNDRYDFTARRIYIADGQDKPPTYIYQAAELKPVHIRQPSEEAPVTIYTAGESGDLRDDFVVMVPAALLFEEAEMRSLVKVYKLAGTQFKIQRF